MLCAVAPHSAWCRPQSIANEILEQNKRGRPLSKLWFVWSVREQGMVGGLLDWDQQLSDPRMPIQFSPDLLSQHCNSIAYACGCACYRPARCSRVVWWYLQVPA